MESSQDKGGARPASTREVVRNEGQGKEPRGKPSYESVVLGPDLGPSTMVGGDQPAPATQQPTPAQPAQPAQPVQPAQPAHPAQPAQPAAVQRHSAPTVAPGDLVANLDNLPPEFATRTLIASAKPGAVAQAAAARAAAQQGAHAAQAPVDTVQISAREVEAELRDPRLVLVHQPDSERAATYRILRHRLVERGHPRTVLVTSAEPRDGKTMLATNLALALSECGRARVLLVEANLRRPGIARMMGFTPPGCFAEQLTTHREKPLEPWVVAQVASPWLHVVAVDPTTFTRPTVLDGPAILGGLEQLKRVQYDYLVLDTPHVLGNADVNLVQDSVDAVVLTGWSGKTSTRAIRQTIDQLTSTKIIGLVILEV